MTKINGAPQNVEVVKQQENQGTSISRTNTADAQLRSAFTFDQKEEQKLAKPLKAHDLNYENFPKKNRLDASDYATRSLNEVKDRAREHNNDFPDNAYVVDYSTFPNPEDFEKKQYGGTDKAYSAWKTAVSEWVEDCKQDMVAAKNTNLTSMTEKFEKTLQSGFFNLYIQMGITQEEIQTVYEKLNGNINKVKAELDKKAEEIKSNSRAVGRQVTRNVNATTVAVGQKVIQNSNENTFGLHEHLDYNTEGVNRHIGDATANVIYNIDNASNKLGRKIDKKSNEIKKVVQNESNNIQSQNQELHNEIMDKLKKMPTKRSIVIDFIKGTLRLPIDVAAAGFDLSSYLLSLPATALKKISELL